MISGRKTDFTIEELVRILDTSPSCAHGAPRGGGYPRDFIIHEIGQIYWGDGAEAGQARFELWKLLESPDLDDRLVACHYLVISFGEMDDETRRKLDEFFRDPSNAALVDRISAY